MARFTDSEMIAALLGKEVGKSPSKFEDHQWIYLPDSNMNSYNGPIRFSTQSWIDDYMLHPKDYVMIPLEAYGQGTVAGFLAADYISVVGTSNHVTGYKPENVKVSVKNGAYSLVNGINLKLNGYTIQNSSDMHLHNHIKSLTTWSRDYAVSNGMIHLYGKDTNSINGSNPAVVAEYNQGFSDRCALTNYDVSFSFPNAGTQAGDANIAANTLVQVQVSVKFTARIHLSVVSDFFDQLGLPLKNCNIDLMINLNGLEKASGNGQNWDMLAIDDKAVTALANGSQKMKLRIQTGQACRLYSPRVTLSPSDAIELAAALETGESKNEHVQKEIIWSDTQVIKNVALSDNGTLDMTLTPGIRRPTEVWSMFFPLTGGNASQLQDQHLAYPLVTAQGVRSPTDDQGVGFTNANLRVDSKKLYEENLDTPFEFYEIVRDQTLAGSDDKQFGSQISIKDFQSLYQFYCFNLTRTAYKITDKPVMLQLSAKKAGNVATKTELYHVIVVETVTLLTLMNGNVLVSSVGIQ